MIPRKDLIRMALEAGFHAPVQADGYMGLAYDQRVGAETGASLERFAALVEARTDSADAERYQWLKDGMRGQVPLVRIQVCKRGYTLVSAEDLDTVIDESIRARSAG